MEILDFINSHKENWKEVLSEKPYCLSIRFYEGKEEHLKNLVILSYNQIFSDFNIPLVRECRGIILEHENGLPVRPVCFPFKKFGNYGEGYVEELDWASTKIFSKKDGSLIRIYFYNNKWNVATNNTINAYEVPLIENALATNDGIKTFGDLFDLACPPWFFSKLDKNYVYMFELCSKYNRVVVPHEEPKLYFLGRRNMITLEEELPGDYLGIETPAVYSFSSLEEVVENSKKLPWDDEGYVAVDKDFRRCKIKSPAYLKIHHLKDSEGNFSSKRVFWLVYNNEIDEVLIYFPELTETVMNMKSKFENKLWAMENAWSYRPITDDRKKFAEWAKTFDCMGFLFAKLDNKCKNARDYFDKMTEPAKLRFMGL